MQRRPLGGDLVVLERVDGDVGGEVARPVRHRRHQGPRAVGRERAPRGPVTGRVAVVDGEQDAVAHPRDEVAPGQVAGQADLDPRPDGQPVDGPVQARTRPAPRRSAQHRSPPRPVAGSTSTTASRPGATTSATVHGTTSSHSCATTSTSSRSVSPGGSAAPPGERSQATASGRSSGRGTTSTPVSRRSGRRAARWVEQLAAAAPDVDDVVHALAVGEAPERVGEGRAERAVGGRREVPGRPRGAPVEPVRAVERVVPRLAPGDHHEPRTLSPRRPRGGALRGHPGTRAHG